MLKTNEVYNMDCVDGIKLLDDKSIDLVVMDPPYLLNMNRVKKTSTFNYFISLGCNYEILTWHKQNPSPLINNNYLPDTEYVVFAREKGVKLYGNYFTKHKYFISGVNQIDKKKYGHPTIKNLNFIENHIINSSKEGDVVLDSL